MKDRGKRACGITKFYLNLVHRKSTIITWVLHTVMIGKRSPSHLGLILWSVPCYGPRPIPYRLYRLRCRNKGLLITYDTVPIAIQKAQYIAQNGLGGGMWWELDADRPIGQGSLIEAVISQWSLLDQKQNELDYPMSSKPRRSVLF